MRIHRFFALAAIGYVSHSCKTAGSFSLGERDIPVSKSSAITPFQMSMSDRSCGNFPVAPIETMDSVCMGVVFQSQDGAFQPRALMEIPGQPGKFLVTDFAGWSTTAGKIWLLDASKGAGAVSMRPFLTGLSIVHQITAGPGDRIYFGEDSRISSFPLALAQAGAPIQRSQTTVAIDNLPPMMRGKTKNSMHPIKHFIFDGSGNIYINVGAYTDHCNDFVGKSCQETDTAINGGVSSDIKDQGASIRRYAFLGSPEKGWSKDYQVLGRGMRNSMGLLFTAKGDLIQVENGRDFPDSARPFEELNLIPAEVIAGTMPAKHYGWPYCYNYNEKSEEWADFSFSCNPADGTYEPPFSLLPPHGAPLGILKYTGDLMPALKSKLLITLHGYRPAGHRIISMNLDPATGRPQLAPTGNFAMDDLSGAKQNVVKSFPNNVRVSPFTEVVSGWYDAPGVRGKGAPVAMVQGSDGAIWMVDDKNAAVLRLAAPSAGFKKPPVPVRPNFSKAFSELVMESPRWLASYQTLRDKVLKSEQCKGCHDNFQNTGDNVGDGLAELRYIASYGNWVVAGDTASSVLYKKLDPPGASSMPPKDKKFPSVAVAQEALAIVGEFIKSMPPLSSIFVVKDGANPELVGLTRGQAGNQVCGKLKPGQSVWVASTAVQKLRGVDVVEVIVGQNSKIADMTACKGKNAFFIANADLRPFAPAAPKK